jgi:hypothetical protein
MEEFETAKSLGISNRDELIQYKGLSEADYPKSSSDELLLLNIITKLENGSKTPFSKTI